MLWSVARADELAPPDDVEAFEREHRHTDRQQLQIMDAIAVEGAVSLLGGIALAIPTRYDDGLRVAGGIDIAFGFVNVALASVVIPLTLHTRKVFERQHPERTTVPGLFDAKRKDATFARQQSLLFSIQLGLDGGYLFVGTAALVASQLGVDHPDRWEAAGITLCAQAVFAAAVDLAELLVSNRRLRSISFAPALSITPTVTTLGLAGRF